VLAEAAFDEEEEAVAAALHPYTNGAGAELAALVADFRRHTAAGIPAPDVGVSVDAYFSFDRQADPPADQLLLALLSDDIVFLPPADGRILAAEHLKEESPMPDPIPVESETPVAEPDDRPLAARSAAALPVAAAQAHAQPAAQPDPAAPWLTR